MFWLIEQVLIALLNVSGSLATKCVSFSNEPCMTRPTLIDLNSVELNYYLFMISLDKYDGSCNGGDNLAMKICVSSKTKDAIVKVFNVITRITEAKTLAKHISCDCKCKFNSTIYNSNKKWDNDKFQCKYKKYRVCEEDYSWNPSASICENCKYLKGVIIDSVIRWMKL